MPTNQQAFNVVQPPTPKFSRQIIKDLNEKPSPAEQRIIDEAKRVQAIAQQKLEIKQNDRNPQNFVKVKVNVLNSFASQTIKTETALATQVDLNELAKPIVLFKQPRQPKVLVQGIRRKVPCSMKKLLPMMGRIGGLHLYDAINLCMTSHKKGSRYIALALRQVRSHALQREMDEERLYVNDAITGKHKRWKRLRYHAKGRGSFMLRNTSQLLIRLEERPALQMFKDVVVGKTPTVLAYFLRKAFVEHGGDYDVLRKNAYLLTAKGRQQKKLMFRRKVTREVLAFRAQGIRISRNIVSKKVMEEEARDLAAAYKSAKLSQATQSLSDRQSVFKKNEEAAGI